MSLKHGKLWVAGGLLAAAVALIALLVSWGLERPSGPVPIAWDRETCAECRMHIGEPSFAVQLQTQDGEILNFDDPGCALRFIARKQAHVEAMYFHHYQEDVWLEQSQTRFIPVSQSPMGYGLGAVGPEAKGALSIDEAKRRLSQAPTSSAQ